MCSAQEEVHCTADGSLQCTVLVQCTVYSVQCTVYSASSAQKFTVYREQAGDVSLSHSLIRSERTQQNYAV